MEHYLMQVNIERRHGFLVKIIMFVLRVIGGPIYIIHISLKRIFSGSILTRLFWSDWESKDLEALYVEFWAVLCLVVNTFFLLPVVSDPTSAWFHICAFIVVLRAADLLWTFLGMNLLLGDQDQKSVARSFIMLGLIFFEMAAIFSSMHYFIPVKFTLGSEMPTLQNVYYYTLRNMLTVGGGDINIIEPNNIWTQAYYGTLRIAQPMFAVLMVTLAISQIINNKRSDVKRIPKKK